MINIITEKIFYKLVGKKEPKYQVIKLSRLPNNICRRINIYYCRYFDVPFIILPNLRKLLLPGKEDIYQLAKVIESESIDYSDWIIEYNSPEPENYLLDVYTKYHNSNRGSGNNETWRLGSIARQGKYTLKNSYLEDVELEFSVLHRGEEIYVAFPEKADEMESNSTVKDLLDFYIEVFIHSNGRIIDRSGKESK